MKVVIIGGAAGSKISQDIFLKQRIPIMGFMNNYVPMEYKHHLKAQDLGDYHLRKNKKILKDPNISYFIGTGDNHMRRDIFNELLEITGKDPINAIDPSAVISPTAQIGSGNLIMPLVVINAYARVEDCTIINTGAVIEHDNVIESFAQISPGVHLGGYVRVKELAMIGIGASIGPHVIVGEGAVVYFGSAVRKNVNPYTAVAGVPAEFKKEIRKI